MFLTMSELEKIALREKEIAKLIEALQKEADELAVARKVIARFAPSHAISIEGALGPPRPEGIPSTFEMTEAVLEKAEAAGKDGLTAKELVEAIRDKYWPGLNSPQVLPTIYGFVKNDRLHKTSGGKFKRLKKA
jgi:alkyl hydroperoxide reductase subunit AhpF